MNGGGLLIASEAVPDLQLVDTSVLVYNSTFTAGNAVSPHFGQGAGFAVTLDAVMLGCSIELLNCTCTGNYAGYGAGVYVEVRKTGRVKSLCVHL